jgi:hypothetical protein
LWRIPLIRKKEKGKSKKGKDKRKNSEVGDGRSPPLESLSRSAGGRGGLRLIG